MSSFIKKGKKVLYNFARNLNHKRKRILWEPMEGLLAKEPDALNGQIIFQKDGCNMEGRHG